MNDHILEIDSLTKRYGKRLAVDGLSFQVNRGDIYGFLGRNGSGKSTTIRMILGLVRPTRGRIMIGGRALRVARSRKYWRVGAIIESPVFYDYLPARTNLELLTSLSGGASRSRIDEILEVVGLTDRQHDNVSVYSHGMRQRLGLAQALLPDPELLVLDEPLDGLDPKGIRHLREVMLNVTATQGVTIFLSSHILSEIELTCNRVVVIHEGRRLYEGKVQALISNTRKVRLRTAGERSPAELLERLPYVERFDLAGEECILELDHDRVPELNRELVGAGIEVLELAPLKQRLEDVFIEMTDAEEHRDGGDG